MYKISNLFILSDVTVPRGLTLSELQLYYPSELLCEGSESRLTDCPSSNIQDCSQDNFAGVECEGL